MKILSPLSHKKGRIEIIPLIDIMFFLLAAFMIVSLNKVKLNSLKIQLPTDVPAATREPKEDFVSIAVDADSQVEIDKVKMTSKDMLKAALKEMYSKNPDQKLLVSGDKEARYGDVVTLLSKLRQAGFQHTAFAVKGNGEKAPNADLSSPSSGSVGSLPPAASAPPAATPPTEPIPAPVPTPH